MANTRRQSLNLSDAESVQRADYLALVDRERELTERVGPLMVRGGVYGAGDLLAERAPIRRRLRQLLAINPTLARLARPDFLGAPETLTQED